MPKARHQQVDQISLEYLVGAVQVTDRYTVAQLPAASTANAGFVVYVTNGNAGVACLAVSNGISWLRLTGAAVNATT